jgi:SAM-dependent methyltransferase
MKPDVTTRTYDRVATAYAARATYPLQAELDRFTSMLAPGSLVLDVGSDPGQYSRMLRRHGLRVIELDLSAGMLHAARQEPGLRHPLDQILADMRRLPLRAGACDGCFVCASLLHLPRADAGPALQGLRGALRPGGALYLAVKEGAGERMEQEPWGSPRLFTYYQRDDVTALLAATGFAIEAGWISPPGPGQRHRWINLFARTRNGGRSG